MTEAAAATDITTLSQSLYYVRTRFMGPKWREEFCAAVTTTISSSFCMGKNLNPGLLANA